MALARTDETVTSALMKISAEADGPISPQMVLDRARDESSPLHDCFEWNDTIAAEKFRMVQARVLLRLVVPVYANSNFETIRIPLFQSVRALRGRDNGEAPSYLPSVSLLSDEQRRLMLVAQKLEQAKFQLSGIKDPHLEKAFKFLTTLIERVDRKRGLI